MKFKISLILAFAILVSLYGCGRFGAKSQKEEIVAYVNKDTISRSDLKKELALRVKLDPAFKITPDTERDQLDLMINRKLIIQEAMKKGLARRERFVNTIKAFWEQTLIRDFIDFKKAEMEDYLFVSDEDARKYYDNLAQKVTFRVFRTKDRRSAEEAYKKYLKDKDASGWQEIGPVGYGDILSSVLLDAFAMDAAQVKRFEEEPDYYIVEVVNKEKTEGAAAPLADLRPEIEKRIIVMKEKRLFEDWLREKRAKSSIKINRELLR